MKKANFSDILKKRETKHNHQFQELCTQLQGIYGKKIWYLPCIKNVTEHKIREAHKIAKDRGIMTIPYLMGIIKRLP